jgi:hypothetical protein
VELKEPRYGIIKHQAERAGIHMKKVRRFDASVSFRDSEGAEREENFPVYEKDYSAAKSMAFS